MKNSSYDIDGQVYEFDNQKFKKCIRCKNPNRGTIELFCRQIESLNVGISYETVKGWIKNDTNPALEDVKIIAKELGINYFELLKCTHYSIDVVNTRFQQISFNEVMDPFCLRYEGFSNVFDMIIGRGYNASTIDYKDSDFAERIINIVSSDKTNRVLPELLGYHFRYSEKELRNMSEDELVTALDFGYINDEGDSFYDKNHHVKMGCAEFCDRLLKNISLEKEDIDDLQSVIDEAKQWWDLCEMPFSLLKINVNAFGRQVASYTYGTGWKEPTHVNKWTLLTDILLLLIDGFEVSCLCNLKKMQVDQFEGEMTVTIETFKN